MVVSYNFFVAVVVFINDIAKLPNNDNSPDLGHKNVNSNMYIAHYSITHRSAFDVMTMVTDEICLIFIQSCI